MKRESVWKLLPFFTLFAGVLFFAVCGGPMGGEGRLFKYTETPTFEMIPGGPVTGNASGRAFEAKAIYFQPFFDDWALYIANKELESPTGFLPDKSEYVCVVLPEKPGKGKKIVKEMSSGGGYYQVFKPGSTGETISWNSDNALVLEITRWEVNEWDPSEDTFQVAGKASGRVAICYRGWGEYTDSWAAGTFKDVVVRFMGKPSWASEKKRSM